MTRHVCAHLSYSLQATGHINPERPPPRAADLPRLWCPPHPHSVLLTHSTFGNTNAHQSMYKSQSSTSVMQRRTSREHWQTEPEPTLDLCCCEETVLAAAHANLDGVCNIGVFKLSYLHLHWWRLAPPVQDWSHTAHKRTDLLISSCIILIISQIKQIKTQLIKDIRLS